LFKRKKNQCYRGETCIKRKRKKKAKTNGAIARKTGTAGKLAEPLRPRGRGAKVNVM